APFYPNNLHPDPGHRAAVNGHTREVIRAAAKLGVPVVNTFVGRDPRRTAPENVEEFRRVWPGIADEAEGLGVEVAIENCQMIDCERAIYEFGDGILHAHATDVEVRADGVYEHGVMSLGMGWQVPRLPGLGQVRWDRFFAALYAVGYDRPVIIEDEDRTFEG